MINTLGTLTVTTAPRGLLAWGLKFTFHILAKLRKSESNENTQLDEHIQISSMQVKSLVSLTAVK